MCLLRDHAAKSGLGRRLTDALKTSRTACLCLAGACLLAGRTDTSAQVKKTIHNDTREIDCITQQIDRLSPPIYPSVRETAAPITALNLHNVQYQNISLDKALSDGMKSSTVLRDIGGIVLRSADHVKTGFAAQLQESDPQFGMESALSEFDARLSASAMFNNNDRIFNNAFFSLDGVLQATKHLVKNLYFLSQIR